MIKYLLFFLFGISLFVFSYGYLPGLWRYLNQQTSCFQKIIHCIIEILFAILGIIIMVLSFFEAIGLLLF